MIRALLYRLLIISAHLQRHGIRLLIAIGRFNARTAAFGADPPAPFDSTNLSTLLFLLLVAPLSLSLSLSFLLSSYFFFSFLPLPFFLSISSRRSSHRRFVPRSKTHYNYLRRRPRGNVFPASNSQNAATRDFARLARLSLPAKELKGIGRNLQEVG